jgi:autophagy-related protein 13
MSFSYQSASFLSTNTDDDDISAFVQDIDSRRPLNGHDRLRDQVHDDPLLLDPATSDSAGPQRRREGGEAHVGSPSDGRIGGGSGSRRPATSHSGPGAMLTSEVEVDERLRQMNETFLASLEGLGGGSGGGGVSGGVRRRRAASEHSSRSGTGSRGERDAAAFPQRGRGGRPPLTSPGSRAESDAGGSEEVMGRMSLDGGSRRQSQAL